jgi:hypothetical protein
MRQTFMNIRIHRQDATGSKAGLLCAALVLPGILASGTALVAGPPLPDATVYGTITVGGEQVGAGELIGIVARQGASELPVAGEFIASGGEHFYVLRVPMTSGSVDEEPSRARPGDTLRSIVLEGTQVAAIEIVLQPGETQEYRIQVDPSGFDRFLRADCNGSMGVDIADAIYTLLHLFDGGVSPGCLKSCDSNDDAQIDLGDALFTLNYLFVGGPVPPPPSVVCGVEPAGGPLSCVSSPCATYDSWAGTRKARSASSKGEGGGNKDNRAGGKGRGQGSSAKLRG